MKLTNTTSIQLLLCSLLLLARGLVEVVDGFSSVLPTPDGWRLHPKCPRHAAHTSLEADSSIVIRDRRFLLQHAFSVMTYSTSAVLLLVTGNSEKACAAETPKIDDTADHTSAITTQQQQQQKERNPLLPWKPCYQPCVSSASLIDRWSWRAT